MPEFAQPLPYQVQAVEHLKSILPHQPGVVDASQTGVGKTYIALFACRHFNLRPLVVAPKALLSNWERACGAVGVDPIMIINYDKIRMGKLPEFTYRKGKHWGDWNVPPGTMIIFDEAHRCRGRTTKNTKLLIAAREVAANPNKRTRVMLLSATLAENCYQMRSIGYALGLFETPQVHFLPWCHMHGLVKGRFGLTTNKQDHWMKVINGYIFPKKGNRLKHSELEGFPETHISAWDIPVANPALVDKAWQEIQDLRESDEDRIEGELRAWLEDEHPEDEEFDPNKYGQGIIEHLRDWQEAELQKVPTLADMAIDLIHDGNNVPVFLNFFRCLREFTDRMKKAKVSHGLINGEVKQKDREDMIDQFQRNKINCLILQTTIGKEGIDLHDLYGRPRVSLISPNWSATDLTQVLGRIHRAGAVSKAIQRVCFAAKTKIERRIRKQVEAKLNNIAALNDGDLR